MDVPLRISYSAVLDWRQCEQLFWYRHVERLRPKVRHAAPELGTYIHSYFDTYYSSLIDTDPKQSHKDALKATRKQFDSNITSLAAIAESLGDEDQAQALMRIPQTARRLLRAYFRVRGRQDAGEHQPIIVEEKFELPVDGKGVVLPGKIDMVTLHDDGVWLWEHKTTGSVPSQGRRFRDLQTLIYKVAVEELYNQEVTGVIWNYVRTAKPQPPRLLAGGALSQAKNQTTTVDLVRSAIKSAGLDPQPYDGFLRQVERKERAVMFPRHTLPLVQSESVLLRDYVASVHQIADAKANKKFVPVRNISAQCDWCSYVKLCQAAVVGGDTRELMQRHYTVGEEKGKKKHDYHR